MDNKTFAFGTLLFGLMMLSTCVGATQLKKVVILGDSLSDTGNLAALTGGLLPPSPLYDPGRQQRFSNGDIWVDDLAAQFGLGVVPGFLSPVAADGTVTNFAVANSFTGSYDWAGTGFGLPQINNFTDLVLTATGQPFRGLPGLAQQLGLYVSQGVAADAAHFIWAGANDLFFADQIIPVSEPNVVDQAVANIRGVLTTLQSQGASDFYVANLPDLGQTPFARGQTQFPFPLTDHSAELSALTAAFNQALYEMITGLDFRVDLVDIAGLFDRAVNDPAGFGFSNVTDPCLDLATLAQQCVAPEASLFWDEVHPTSVAHQYIGNAFIAAVPEPAVPALLSAGLMLLLVRSRSARSA